MKSTCCDVTPTTTAHARSTSTPSSTAPRTASRTPRPASRPEAPTTSRSAARRSQRTARSHAASDTAVPRSAATCSRRWPEPMSSCSTPQPPGPERRGPARHQPCTRPADARRGDRRPRHRSIPAAGDARIDPWTRPPCRPSLPARGPHADARADRPRPARCVHGAAVHTCWPHRAGEPSAHRHSRRPRALRRRHRFRHAPSRRRHHTRPRARSLPGACCLPARCPRRRGAPPAPARDLPSGSPAAHRRRCAPGTDRLAQLSASGTVRDTRHPAILLPEGRVQNLVGSVIWN